MASFKTPSLYQFIRIKAKIMLVIQAQTSLLLLIVYKASQ